MKKLFLLEDEEVMNPVEEPVQQEQENDHTNDEVGENELSHTNLISALIKGEWDAIDQYNSMIATLNSMGDNDNCIPTLKEIVSEEYIHVGQLEKLLQSINPQVDNIEAGHNHEDVEGEAIK